MKVKCPRCGKETDMEQNPFRPFCSERCKMLDLSSWISGEYRIPGSDASDKSGSGPKPEKDSDEE